MTNRKLVPPSISIGDQWSLLVLRDIRFRQPADFRVLQACLEEGIASKILADRLRRLVLGRSCSRERMRVAGAA